MCIRDRSFNDPITPEEFIKGIRHIFKDQEEDDSTYKISDGVLKRIAKKAKKAREAERDLEHYLIIDELNGGDPAKIFGELFTLIENDKRNTYTVTLPYSGERFSIPDNLYIIATMNTADRTSTVLDTALRRRFFFCELEPDSELIGGSDKKGNINQEDSDNNSKSTINLRKILDTLNDSITKEIDRDHRIGHAYFMKIEDIKDLETVWYHQIIPLLMDYFYNDNDKIKEIIGEKFVSDDKGIIERLEGDKFIEALKEKFNDDTTKKGKKNNTNIPNPQSKKTS